MKVKDLASIICLVGTVGVAYMAYKELKKTKEETKKKEEEFKKAKDEFFEDNDDVDTIINSSDIEALYIPLPPGLHYKWAKKALEAGKHVLVEKPSTTSLSDTRNLISIAKEKGLALS